MNDPVKYMMMGAGIAIVSGVLSATGVAWALRSEKRAAAPPPPMIRPAAMAPADRSGGKSGGIFTMPSVPASKGVFQEAQSRPEVKAAHEAYLEAQKKYLAAMQSAMGKQPGSVVTPLPAKPPVLPASTTTNPPVRVAPGTPSGR